MFTLSLTRHADATSILSRCARHALLALSLCLVGCEAGGGFPFFNLEPLDAAAEEAASPAIDMPVVVQVQRYEIPYVPERLALECPSGPDGGSAWGCPVIRWHGLSYWSLSYDDGRDGVEVMGFEDTTGSLVNVILRRDVRHIYDVVVDVDEEQVVIWGEFDRSERIRWSTLRFD